MKSTQGKTIQKRVMKLRVFWYGEMLSTVSHKHCHSIKTIRYSLTISFQQLLCSKLLKWEGFLAVPTLHIDTLNYAGKFLKSANELKKSNLGSFHYVVDYNLGITILRWFDKVKLISNYIGNSPGEPARCCDGEKYKIHPNWKT